jgi:hypothetical protein
MAGTLSHVKTIYLPLALILFKRELQLALPTSKVSDLAVDIFVFLQLGNKQVKRVLGPFLNLLPVTFMVVCK